MSDKLSLAEFNHNRALVAEAKIVKLQKLIASELKKIKRYNMGPGHPSKGYSAKENQTQGHWMSTHDVYASFNLLGRILTECEGTGIIPEQKD